MGARRAGTWNRCDFLRPHASRAARKSGKRRSDIATEELGNFSRARGGENIAKRRRRVARGLQALADHSSELLKSSLIRKSRSSWSRIKPKCQKYLDTRIATSGKNSKAKYGRYQDEPLLDLIHKAQLGSGTCGRFHGHDFLSRGWNSRHVR
jgi:hypothetical protein